MAKRRSKLPYSTFLEVEWEDAASNDGWVAKDEDTSPEIIVSRGWLVKDEIGYITLANSIHKTSDAEVGGTQTIPRGMIRHCKELKVSHARSKPRDKVHPEPAPTPVHREPGEG